jgi:PAS domain-containing protein
MSLTHSLTRFGVPSMERKAGTTSGLANLASLSQRKLNALGLPLAYVDCDRRYRFANLAFLEWTGKVFTDVVGQEIQDVVGQEAFLLYELPQAGRDAGACARGGSQGGQGVVDAARNPDRAG